MPTKLGYRSAKSVSYSPKTSDYSLNLLEKKDGIEADPGHRCG